MNTKKLYPISLSFIVCAMLAGCGSDDKDEPLSVSVAASTALKENRTTTITAMVDNNNGSTSYQWSQLSGPSLTLAGSTSAAVSVTAPAVDANSTAVLRVTVTDQANQSASADVTVNIANNVAPTVTSAFESVAEKSAVTLTATATDPDGTITSYSWLQTSGAAVTLTGADTATLSFTAPDVTEDTDLGFSITVTDDDNESTVLTGIITVTPILATYTVSGTVAGAAFANAQVSGTLAGQAFLTTADTNGNFSLPLQADDDETNLFANLTVKSATSAGLEYYKFVPQLTADVVPAAASSKTRSVITNAVIAADENSNVVAINAVSTALYSLIVAANNGIAPSDLAQFTLVEKSVSPDELIEAAAVVQLVTQGGTFALPEGVSNVLELLTNTQAYNSYVTAAETASPGIISSTIDSIIADPSLTPPVTASSLASAYFEVYPAAEGFLSRGGNRFEFNDDGSGAETYARGVDVFSWVLTDGAIQLTYAEATGTYAYPTVRVGVAGLTQQQVDKLRNANFNQIEIQQVPYSASMKRLIEGEKIDTFRITSRLKETMTPITLPSGEVISTDGIVYESTYDQLMRNADKLADMQYTADEVVSDWVVEHYYYAGEPNFGYAGMFADLFEVKADGTGLTYISGKNFTWALDDKGAFIATFTDGSSVHVTKMDQSGSDIQVFSSSYDAQGQLIAAEADYAIELEDGVISEFDLTNPEGMYWNTTINTWGKNSWSNGALLWDDGAAYFGWQFNENGNGFQMGNYQQSPPNFTPLFNTPLTWNEDIDEFDASYLSINRWMCVDIATAVCAKRDWHLLKVSDGILGQRIYVFEVENRRNDSQSPWYIASGLGPRINMYEEISFDYWNESAPTNTATVSGFAKTAQGKTIKPSVARILLEPNKKSAFGR